MNNKKNVVALLALLSSCSVYATPDIFITPMIGYTAGGSVEDQFGNTYDVEASESYTVALETTIDKGRFGLFYSNQKSQLETLKLESSVQYLHVQSSLYYPFNNNLSSYLGLGLGASYTDADWVNDKYGFSTSVFGGLEYKLTDNIAINSQVRWLGTVVDNKTTSACNLPSGGQQCVIKFDTDWMNQFQANVGLTIMF